MIFLFDQHLSRHLVRRLGDLFPGSAHLSAFGMEESSDDEIWTLAIERGYTIVSKDVDFRDKCSLDGWPPKVLWGRSGKCPTGRVEQLIRSSHRSIRSWDDNPNSGIYELF